MADQTTPPDANPGSPAPGAAGIRPPAAEPVPAAPASETAGSPRAPAPTEEDSGNNFRQPNEARGRAPAAERTPDAAKNEIAEVVPDETRLIVTLSPVGQKVRPSRIEDAIKGEIPIARFRDALSRLTSEKAEQIGVGPLAVLASDIVGPSLAIAAAVCQASTIQYVRLSDNRFDMGSDAGQLAALIQDTLASSPEADLIVDARVTAQHPPFWQLNKSLSAARVACAAAGIRALVIVRKEDFKRETNRDGMDEWRKNSMSLQQIERAIVVALAEEEDDRLQRDPAKSSLERRLDLHERHVQELWDALADDGLSAFVDELGKGFEASRAGRREELFRQAVINPETRNPAQATALFLGAFLPDLRRQNFLEIHQHLHVIAGANWRPRKKDQDGEIEKWDATPSDFDRAHVGITFESDGTDQLLRARIGGAAAIAQFRGMFVKTGADALRLFIEGGLTTFPLLASGDDKALAGLVSLSEDKFRREQLSPLDVDQVRREALSLAFTHSPRLLANAETNKVASAAATYLSELAERLPLASLSDNEGSRTIAALRLLLEDVLELARNCELQENGADWLHDVIARTAFIHPTLRWHMVFCDLYENEARLRQRTILTDRFWQIAINAIGERADLLRDAMREAAKLLSMPDSEGVVQSFRTQILSRLVTVWLFSVAAAMTEKRSPDASKPVDAAILFDEGLIRDVSAPLLSTRFNSTHCRLAEIEFDVIIRTRGSEEDAHVLERIQHLNQVARVVRSTCLSVLQTFLPLTILGDDQKLFLDRLASIIDKSTIGRPDPRAGSFFASHRWVSANMMADQREVTPLSSFEEAVHRWLVAMPLAVIMAERELSASPTPLATLLSRSTSNDIPRRLGQQIDAMRADQRSAREALASIDNRETRKRAEEFLIDRRTALEKLRAELLTLIQQQVKVG